MPPLNVDIMEIVSCLIVCITFLVMFVVQLFMRISYDFRQRTSTMTRTQRGQQTLRFRDKTALYVTPLSA